MKRADVSFTFLNDKYYGFAKRRLKTGVYEENFYSVDEIIRFMITSINSNQIRKGKKIDLGKTSDVIYNFKYVTAETMEENNNKEMISIRIPGNSRKEYVEIEKNLDSLINISSKLNKAALAKVTALMVAGMTFMTFATVKIAKIADYEYKKESSKVQSYVQSLGKSPYVSEYDRLCYEIKDLEEQINFGQIPDVALEQNIKKLESMKRAKVALEASSEQNKQSSNKYR